MQEKKNIDDTMRVTRKHQTANDAELKPGIVIFLTFRIWSSFDCCKTIQDTEYFEENCSPLSFVYPEWACSLKRKQHNK